EGVGERGDVQTTMIHTYEHEVLKPAEEIVSLLTAIEAAIAASDTPLLRSLRALRDSFTTSLVAANAYYSSLDGEALQNAQQSIALAEQAIPEVVALAEDDQQRSALRTLSAPAASFREGLRALSKQFKARTDLLKTAIDGNQVAMGRFIETIWQKVTLLEAQAQESFDRALSNT